MQRRQFLKYGMGGLTALALSGVEVPGVFNSESFAAVQNIDLTFTDAYKNMLDNTPCYHWCFKSNALPLPSIPGPIIFARPGDTINLTLTNMLDENHNFTIPGVFDSGTIPPDKAPRNFTFPVPAPGTYMYFDALNAPVNRVMGLHGALIVTRPAKPVGVGNKITPYANPTPAVQQLFNDLGSTPHFPGLSWGQGDKISVPRTPSFRQWIWLLHQADAVLFEQVGSLPAGQLFDPRQFVRQFNPKYFTITGESGYFVHFNRNITPWARVGEPGVIRVLNAGLWTHSLHIHCNHCYVLAENGAVSGNLHWVDTYTVHPMDRIDWLVPFHRPPDIPNVGGRGLPETPMTTINGGTTWPPMEELGVTFRTMGTRTAAMSPLFYPMHDHTETSQTISGGNYTQGLLGGMIIIGDRTLPGGIVDFPIYCKPQK